MKKLINLSFLLFIILSSCKKEIEAESTTVSIDKLEFKKSGGTQNFSVITNVESWDLTLTENVNWVTIVRPKGSQGTTFADITVAINPLNETRTTKIKLTTSGGITKEVLILQSGDFYPSYNTSPATADKTGMSSSAMELGAKIKLGWNAGNTLEATGGETAWGNPKITPELIKLVKVNGFNAIRLPCSWNQYADKETAKINTDWLNRVKDIVKICVDNDMYVLLNIHWDGGWLENNCTPEKKDENNGKQKAYWQQIATQLRDFDEHLLFASANEPNVDNATQMDVLMSYHQTFIDAVRSTGGKNAYRVLVVQGPSTDIDKTNKLMTKMPTDKIADRLMAEIHFYTPWNFCGLTTDESWGKQFYYWGKDFHSTADPSRNPSWGEEATVDELLASMKKKFVDNGIPVIMGEFSVTRRLNLAGDALKLHLASRAYYNNYVVKQARANKLIPFYWDNGGIDNFASGIFDRKKNSVFDKQVLDALQ